MNKRKKVVLGTMIFGVMMISIIGVNAGILDWFKFGSDDGGEGELPDAADVSITMANSVPHIESWTMPDFDTTVGGLDPWPPTSCNNPSATTVVTGGNSLGVDVNVSDANTDSDLNGAGLVDIIITRGAVTHAGSCTLDAGSIDGDNQATFNCQFDMDFYDPAAGDWLINITAQDTRADPADNNGEQSDGTSAYPYFTYGSLYDIRIKDDDDTDYLTGGGPGGEDTLTWSGITATSASVASERYMTLQNCGNEALDGTNPYSAADSYVTVKGFDLSNPTNTDKMEPDTFSVDQTSSPCGAGQLLDNDATYPANILKTPVLDVVATTGALVEDDMYFCLEDINPSAFRGNDPITVDSYSTTNTGGASWEIIACESTCQSV